MPRKEKEYKYHFIYKTTNIKNGKFYIGMHSTNNLEDGYLGSGKRLKNSIRYYGKGNHIREILEFLLDRTSLKDREREIINEKLLGDPLCINLMEGGEGGGGFIYQNKNKRKEIARKGQSGFIRRCNNDPEFKKKLLAEASLNLKKRHDNGEYSNFNYANFKDKKHREETKKKIGNANSIKQSGKNNSQYGKYWVHKNSEVLRIHSIDLEKYLILGWKKGKQEKVTKQTKWIYKENKRIKIDPSKLEKYISNGWISKEKSVL